MVDFYDYDSFTDREKNYFILINFLCKENGIKLKFVDAVPLQDGSYDGKLAGICDFNDKTIYVRKSINNHPTVENATANDEIMHYNCIMTLVNCLAKFIAKVKNIQYNNEAYFEFDILARRYLFGDFADNEIKNDKKYDEFKLETIFEFVFWMKNKLIRMEKK